MKDEQITCAESDVLRKGLNPWASRTNYHKGDESYEDPRFPAENYIEWADDDDVVRLIETLDKDGCRHTRTERDMKESDDVG